MPTRSGVARRPTGLGELSQEQEIFLVEGWILDSTNPGMVDEYGHPVPFQSWESCEQAYRHHRAKILTLTKTWQCGNGSDFGRDLPWAFWKFEATEPRLQTGGPRPLKGKDPEAWRGFFGEAVLWGSYEKAQRATFETDAQNVKRLEVKI